MRSCLDGRSGRPITGASAGPPRGDRGGTMPAVASPTVEGHVSRGFESVRDVFADNFVHRGERGGACCAYYRGQNVVDLWGGSRNTETGEPWERDTMVVVWSASK